MTKGTAERRSLLEFTEKELLGKLKDGDELAFRAIFDLHFRRLYTFCFRFLKDKEQSEEVVHDALINFWVNRKKVNEDLSILPYLYTITRRLALNHLRNIATSKKAIDELWNTMERLSNETEESILLNDLRQFTETAVVNLPPQQQVIFRLSRYEGLNYDEIAEQTGLSRNTVKNHLVAALKTLRTHFNQSDVAYFVLLSTVLLK
jgi:RNA polymerase sigma-70 factor (family 1)